MRCGYDAKMRGKRSVTVGDPVGEAWWKEWLWYPFTSPFIIGVLSVSLFFAFFMAARGDAVLTSAYNAVAWTYGGVVCALIVVLTIRSQGIMDALAFWVRPGLWFLSDDFDGRLKVCLFVAAAAAAGGGVLSAMLPG